VPGAVAFHRWGRWDMVGRFLSPIVPATRRDTRQRLITSTRRSPGLTRPSASSVGQVGFSETCPRRTPFAENNQNSLDRSASLGIQSSS